MAWCILVPEHESAQAWDVLALASEVWAAPALVVDRTASAAVVAQYYRAGADRVVSDARPNVEVLMYLRRLVTVRTACPVRTARGIAVDFEKHTVSVAGMAVGLRAKEYALLAVLVACAGAVVPYRKLLQAVWHGDHFDTNLVHVHMRNLRRALAQAGQEDAIVNVRGVGYVIPA